MDENLTRAGATTTVVGTILGLIGAAIGFIVLLVFMIAPSAIAASLGGFGNAAEAAIIGVGIALIIIIIVPAVVFNALALKYSLAVLHGDYKQATKAGVWSIVTLGIINIIGGILILVSKSGVPSSSVTPQN